MNKYLLSLMMVLPLTTTIAFAQDSDEASEVEEIVTTGIIKYILKM